MRRTGCNKIKSFLQQKTVYTINETIRWRHVRLINTLMSTCVDCVNADGEFRESRKSKSSLECCANSAAGQQQLLFLEQPRLSGRVCDLSTLLKDDSLIVACRRITPRSQFRLTKHR